MADALDKASLSVSTQLNEFPTSKDDSISMHGNVHKLAWWPLATFYHFCQAGSTYKGKIMDKLVVILGL